MDRFNEDAFGRSIYQAAMEVQFNIAYNALNETLYSRVDRILTFASLLAGAATVVNFFQALGPVPNGILGLVVASCAAVQAIWQPANAAAAHKEGKKAFFALNSVIRSLSIDDAYARIDSTRANLPDGWFALNGPACNRARTAQGHPAIELGRLERVAASLTA
jgi:hypothetical protein